MSSLSMDNTGRKIQEERNLRLLRELASFPQNKQCFDCHQRGPTYVNMTIGSFVCTKCSGLLRGLTPPHRVKSISMATFTPSEIEFLRARGNEYCRSVWAGRYGGIKGPFADGAVAKDETQTKDYLILKYETKRWYVHPDEAASKRQTQKLSPPPSPMTVLSTSPNLFLRRGDIVKPKSPASDPSPPSANVLFDPFDHFGTKAPHSNTNQQHFFKDPIMPKSATMPLGIMAPAPSIANGGQLLQPAVDGEKDKVEVKKTSQEKATDKYAALAELDELYHVSSPATLDVNKNGPTDVKASGGPILPPSFTMTYAPYASNNFYSTPYLSFGQPSSVTATFGNPFPSPGALQQQQQHWVVSTAACAPGGPHVVYGFGQNVNAGFPLATQYAQSIVSNGMNPFMASAVRHPAATTPRNPFL